MAHFTVGVTNLAAQGPIVEVLVLPREEVSDALLKSEYPLSKPLKQLAMIDTGATCSVLKEGTAAQLGLNPIGRINISTPSSTGFSCFRYSVQIGFPNVTAFVPSSVIEAPLKNQHIQCLIGCDILKSCVFIYTGSAGTFTLCF